MNGNEDCTREEGGSRAAQRRRKKASKSKLKHEKQQERVEKQRRHQNSNNGKSIASVPPEGTCEGGITGTAMSNKNNAQKLKRRKRDSNQENEVRVKSNVIVANAHDSLDETNIIALCNRHCVNSSLRAQLAAKWLISPVDYNVFYDDYWEKNPLLISRNCLQNQYNDGLVSSKSILQLIRSRRLLYGSDLDITNYVNGHRVTLNPLPDVNGGEDEAVVSSEYVEAKLQEGCSLRMLCPQKYFDSVHALLSALEEEWGCMVGSNVYFTPSGHQGFAPHWDDIEAFLLQVEGVKRWRVYAPTGEETTLPRYSSGNLSPQDMSGRELIIDRNLKPGDLLYIPRGVVHEGVSVGTEHSLHVTISCFQKNAWVDFTEMLMSRAVLSAAEQNTALRAGLPRNFLKYHGISNMSDEGEDEISERVSFQNTLKRHVDLICKTALSLVDETADELAKKYIGDRLPPVFSTLEESSTVLGKSARDLTLSSRLRMIRADIARLVLEDGKAVVYHAMDNSRVHNGARLNPLEFEIDDAPAIETLLHAYPRTVSIKDLPHPPAEDPDDKISIARSLYNEGFLVVEDVM